LDSFKVNRNLHAGRYRLREVFDGLDRVAALRRYFGNSDSLAAALTKTEVALTPDTRYMYVNEEDGSLVAGLEYVKTADTRYLYLDIIHELVHIKQFRDGKNLFDEAFSYVDRPTEIEAYSCAVEVARELGMNDQAIADYLYVEWITRNEHARLLKRLGVEAKPSGSSRAKPD